MLTETQAQKLARKENGRNQRIKLFRNNIGVARYVNKKTGKVRSVRYGVGGKGGADEIGFVVEAVTPEWYEKHKGKKVAIFLAIEWKRAGKDRTDAMRKKMQGLFRQGITNFGGRSGIATCAADVRRIAGLDE